MDFDWDNPAGGSFTETTNWDPFGVPGATDNVTFGLDATYAVGFIINGTSSTLTVSDGDVTFEPTGAGGAHHTYTMTSAAESTTIDGGDLTVTGNATDTFELAGANMRVGDAADGTLSILAGGTVSSAGVVGIIIADDDGSTGQITVDDGGTISLGILGLNVGRFGNGTLLVQNGGTVSTGNGTVGDNSDSIGAATVDGPGSMWTMTAELRVGRNGQGTLLIENEGVVSSTNGNLGNGANGDGEVTVDGAGSMWTVTNNLDVAGDGQGTLTVQNGGLVDVGGNAVLGADADSAGTLAFGIGDDGSGTIASGLLVVDGELSHDDGAAVFDLFVEAGAGFSLGDAFTLVDYGTLQAGFAFDNLVDDGLWATGVYEFQVDFNADLGGGDLAIVATVTGVPEPGSLVLLVVAIFAVPIRHRG